MKKICIFASLISCAFSTIAQTNEEGHTLNNQPITEIVIVKDTPDTLANGEVVYEAVDDSDMPHFPGGNEAMYAFLSSNLNYPSEALENEIQGRVVIKFVVKADGSIGTTEIVKSVHPALDAEAERLVRLMPKWTPGKYDGKPANVWFSIPVIFKLQGDTPSVPALSERDQADFDNFMRLGDEALSSGNTNHAYQYFKECFNIKPWEFSLIDKIDSLLDSNQSLNLEFLRWASGRVMQEFESNPQNTTIDNLIALQNKILDITPNDPRVLYALEYFYFISRDYNNTFIIAEKIYPLVEHSNPILYADAMELCANALLNEGGLDGVIALIEPSLSILKQQHESLAVFYMLAEARMLRGEEDEAKEIYLWMKNTAPDKFNELLERLRVTNPDNYQIISNLLN